MKNNYTLINVDGYPTRWGFWDPQSLNNNTDHYSERYSNTIEIIAFLSVSYHYTKDKKYLDGLN